MTRNSNGGRLSREPSSLTQGSGRSKIPDECAGTLLFKARRGELGPADLQAFEGHLKNCVSCQFFRQVALDLDDAGAAQPGDAAQIARMMGHARQQFEGHSGSRRSRVASPFRLGTKKRALGLAAAALLVTGGASGAWWYTSVLGPVRSVAMNEMQVSNPPLKTTREDVGSSLLQAPPVPVEVPPAPESPAIETNPAPGVRVALAPLPKPLPDKAPDALFREANKARRQGQSGSAIRLYESLQKKHPRSPEAQMSHLLLARVLLDAGRARSALGEFDQALGSSTAAPVHAEALYGKGQALAALGASDRERSTWNELIARFPKSPYARHAKDRLSQLK